MERMRALARSARPAPEMTRLPEYTSWTSAARMLLDTVRAGVARERMPAPAAARIFHRLPSAFPRFSPRCGDSATDRRRRPARRGILLVAARQSGPQAASPVVMEPADR